MYFLDRIWAILFLSTEYEISCLPGTIWMVFSFHWIPLFKSWICIAVSCRNAFTWQRSVTLSIAIHGRPLAGSQWGFTFQYRALYLFNHCHRLHIYVVESHCLRACLCQVAGLFVQSQCDHDCDYLQECGHFVTPLHCWGISDTTQDQHHIDYIYRSLVRTSHLNSNNTIPAWL